MSVYAVVKGNDAYEVTALPMNWLWNQEGANYSYADIKRMIEQGTSPSDFPILIDKVETLPDGTLGNSCTQLSVVNGGVAQQFQITSVVTSDRRVTASFNNVTGRVWVTQCPNTLESGWVDVTVSHTLRIPFWCNLLGTWREIIFADTRMSIAEKTQYLDNQYTQFHAEYVQSSQVVSNKLTKIDGIIGPNGEKMDEKLNTSEFKQTADSFSLCTTTYASNQASDAERNAKNAAQGYANTAENNAKEHADDVGDDIKTRLYQTGILIDGNNRKIELQADHTVFKSSSGDNKKIWIDATDGTLHAVNGHFSGDVTASSGSITGNINIGTTGSKMQIFVDEALGLSKNSGIRGVNSSDQELVRLGFQEYSNKVRAFLRFGMTYYREDGLTLVDNNGTFTVGIRDGKAYMNAPLSCWPTEGRDNIGDLPPGTVYLRSDSCLGIKR